MTAQALALGTSVVFTGDSEGATLPGDAVAGSLIAQVGLPNVWHAFTLSECADLTIAYCGTDPVFSNVWNLLANSCPADEMVFSVSNNTDDCADGNRTAYYTAVEAGTYYLPVLVDPFSNSEGPYTVTVTADDCFVGVKEVDHTWGVFPNPSNGVLFVRTNNLHGTVTWELSDASGRLVHSEVHGAVAEGLFELRPQVELAPGTYVLRATHSAGVSTQRVVMQ